MEVERRSFKPRRGDDHTVETALKRVLWRGAVGYLILLAFCLIGAMLLEQRTDQRLRASQLASCQRLNLQRERINGLAITVWRAYQQGYQREMTLAKTDPNPAHAKSAASFKAAQRFLTTQQLTDCAQAIDFPYTYAPPPLAKITKLTEQSPDLHPGSVALPKRP